MCAYFHCDILAGEFHFDITRGTEVRRGTKPKRIVVASERDPFAPLAMPAAWFAAAPATKSFTGRILLAPASTC